MGKSATLRGSTLRARPLEEKALAMRRVEREVLPFFPSGALEGPLAANRRFLDLCTDPNWTRIPLIDAPSVLGWAEWRAADMRFGLGLASLALTAGMDAGALRRAPVRPLAHLLLAAMGEAGLMIAQAEDPEAERAEVEPTLVGLIEGLRL
jgi:hypothetical protein